MTAVEWLRYELNLCKEKNGIIEITEGLFDSLIEQAKEMERSQMIEFAKNLPLKSGLLQEGGTYCERGNVEEYYNKVYGGSVVSEEVKGKSSQAEISDEEIEKEIKKRYETTQNDAGFRDGCAWYREQLKNKQ